MKAIRVVIADDEPLLREGVATMLGDDPEIDVVGICADGSTALETIKAERPELAFLDVQMPGLDGFEVLDALLPEERPHAVVFMTAHDRYAVRAFEFFAVDYLLKPFETERFNAALSRAKNEVRLKRARTLSNQVEQLLEHVRELSAPNSSTQATPSSSESADRVVLKAGSELHFVKPDEIVWVEAQGDFLKVQTTGPAHLVRETLQDMEGKLDSAKFLRIHRSFLVHVGHIKKVSPALYGDYTVFMSDGAKLRLSRNYRHVLRTMLS